MKYIYQQKKNCDENSPFSKLMCAKKKQNVMLSKLIPDSRKEKEVKKKKMNMSFFFSYIMQCLLKMPRLMA